MYSVKDIQVIIETLEESGLDNDQIVESLKKMVAEDSELRDAFERFGAKLKAAEKTVH